MGQRANLIVVDGPRYELFYSHWCANTLTRDLFWGPEVALAFIRIQRIVDETGWLDDVWAEGGAVVDRSNKVLVLYGGEDLKYDVPLRRVYLSMLRRAWHGWEVRWAHEGIADLADYVAFPREKVLTPHDETSEDCSLDPPQERAWLSTIGSARRIDGSLRFFPLPGDVPAYLGCGGWLREATSREPGLERLDLRDWTASFPTGGFHLDHSRRELTIWSAPDMPGGATRVEASWPGWNVRWCRDRFEAQLELSEGNLRYPSSNSEDLQRSVVSMLMHDDSRSQVEYLLELAERERSAGRTMEINPYALRDDRISPSRDERIKILNSISIRFD